METYIQKKQQHINADALLDDLALMQTINKRLTKKVSKLHEELEIANKQKTQLRRALYEQLTPDERQALLQSIEVSTLKSKLSSITKRMKYAFNLNNVLRTELNAINGIEITETNPQSPVSQEQFTLTEDKLFK